MGTYTGVHSPIGAERDRESNEACYLPILLLFWYCLFPFNTSIRKCIKEKGKREKKKKREREKEIEEKGKYFLVVSISLCKADRQGEAVESGFHRFPREIVTVEVLKTKLNSALVNMLQGITPHWARSGQDQLTDLFYVYFLLFLTVRRKLCKGRAQSSLPHLSESRLHYAAHSCLILCSL